MPASLALWLSWAPLASSAVVTRAGVWTIVTRSAEGDTSEAVGGSLRDGEHAPLVVVREISHAIEMSSPGRHRGRAEVTICTVSYVL